MAIARLCALALDLPTRWPGSMRDEVPEPEARVYLDAGFAQPRARRQRRARPAADRGRDVALRVPGRATGSTSPGREEAERAAEDAIEIAARMRRPMLVSAALDALSSVWVQNGDWGHVERVTARRLAIVDEVDDPWELGDIYAVAAWGAFHQGRYRRAHELAFEGGRRVAGRVPGGARAHPGVGASSRASGMGEWDRALLEFEVLRELLGDRRDEPPYFASRPLRLAGACCTSCAASRRPPTA